MNIFIIVINILVFVWAIYYLIIALMFFLIFLRSLIGPNFAELKWEELSHTFFSRYFHTHDLAGGLSYDAKTMKLEGYSGKMTQADFIADFVRIFRIYTVRCILVTIIYMVLSFSFPNFFYLFFVNFIKDFLM